MDIIWSILVTSCSFTDFWKEFEEVNASLFTCFYEAECNKMKICAEDNDF